MEACLCAKISCVATNCDCALQIVHAAGPCEAALLPQWNENRGKCVKPSCPVIGDEKAFLQKCNSTQAIACIFG